MKQTAYILLVLSLSHFLSSCDRTDYAGIKKQRIQDEIAKRSASFRQLRLQECQDELMKRAQSYVDSAVISELVVDPNNKMPARPTKPSYPERIRLDDSTRVGSVME